MVRTEHDNDLKKLKKCLVKQDVKNIDKDIDFDDGYNFIKNIN